VGQDVFAIGNPFGYRKTVTKGIVSAIHREFKIGNEILFEDLIQTDTSVNPGNSGGPLIDMKGEMIGLIHAREWRAQGIGFAIPVNRIKTLIPEMKAGKDQDIQTETFQKRFGFFPKNCKSTNAGDPEQVMVSEISLGSALQKAGVRVGDLIRQFQKKQIRSAKQLVEEAETIKPGERVYLEIERQGRTLFTYFEVKS